MREIIDNFTIKGLTIESFKSESTRKFFILARDFQILFKSESFQA